MRDSVLVAAALCWLGFCAAFPAGLTALVGGFSNSGYHEYSQSSRAHRELAAPSSSPSSPSPHCPFPTSSSPTPTPLQKQPSLIRFRGKVSFDGTSFLGWQTQRSLSHRTVQGTLEEAIGKLYNLTLPYSSPSAPHETIETPSTVVIGSGRTDTGVHAREQNIHFEIPSDRFPHAPPTDVVLKSMTRSINSLLPDDVVLYALSLAPTQRWHSILSSKSKIYSYRFAYSPRLDPLLRRTRSHVYYEVSLPLLSRILCLFKGSHDFSAFACQVASNLRKRSRNFIPSATSTLPPSFVRTIHTVTMFREGPACYRIDFHLSGALYKMVRNIVGFALAASRVPSSSSSSSHHTFSDDKAFRSAQSLLLRLFNEEGGGVETLSTRCSNPYKPSPPNGLCLSQVIYRTT